MRPRLLSTLGVLVLLLCCSRGERETAKAATGDQPPARPGADGKTAIATFAGGCFWCMQPAYDHVPGVLSTTVGYTGGHLPNPTYEQVGSGGTGHRESIEVPYDPANDTS